MPHGTSFIDNFYIGTRCNCICWNGGQSEVRTPNSRPIVRHQTYLSGTGVKSMICSRLSAFQTPHPEVYFVSLHITVYAFTVYKTFNAHQVPCSLKITLDWPLVTSSVLHGQFYSVIEVCHQRYGFFVDFVMNFCPDIILPLWILNYSTCPLWQFSNYENLWG